MKKLSFILFFLPTFAFGFNASQIKSEFKQCLNISNFGKADNVRDCLELALGGVKPQFANQYCGGSARSALVQEINKRVFTNDSIKSGFDLYCKRLTHSHRD